MKCIILEDESTARKLLEKMVNETDSLELTKSFSSSVECYKFLNANDIDLLFLDVEMPGMTGLEMISNLPMQPLIIFTTGHKNYALNSFEHRVVDFLVKPFSYARFLKAVMKAKEILKTFSNVKSESNSDYLFIKQPGRFLRISFSEIRFIEALGDYINIYTSEKKYTIHETLKNFMSRLPPYFLRVHRSFAVNADLINSIEDNTIFIQGKGIPIGISYRENVYKKFKLS